MTRARRTGLQRHRRLAVEFAGEADGRNQTPVVSSQRRNRRFFVPRCKSGRDLVDKKWAGGCLAPPMLY
jgi:hypothetical protein